tara:strand:+ start:705 stop:905 length:201 start_codon:yes stop_codon:yes gene_type:complete
VVDSRNENKVVESRELRWGPEEKWFSQGEWGSIGEEQYSTPIFITTFFCDISLLRIISNRQVSHFM